MVRKIKDFLNKIFLSSWVVWLFSFVWFLARTGTKPTRAIYPCQQVARNNIAVFGIPVFLTFWNRLKKCSRFRKKIAFSLASVVLLVFAGIRVYKAVERKGFYQKALAQSGSPRVVWIEDSAATAGTSWGSDFIGRANASAVDRMMDRAIMALTGTTSVSSAWRQIFLNHQGRDYVSGEKIAIKLNFNNTLSSDQISRHHNPVPETVNALVRQLVQEKGVFQQDIILYDITRDIPSGFRSEITLQFPNVVFIDKSNRTFSNETVLGTRLAGILEDADYLINMPLLRTHNSSARVTLSFKNHLGSNNNPGAFHTRMGEFSNNSLVLLNSHSYIRDKTILVASDALYGLKTGGPNGVPNITPNSFFLSQDPVAADSVMVDYMEAIGANTSQQGGNPRNYMIAASSIGLGVHEQGNPMQGASGYNRIDFVRCQNGTCPGTQPPASPSPSPTCKVADVNCDGKVNVQDLLLVLAGWGPASGREDVNGDGIVNVKDFLLLLENWGI